MDWCFILVPFNRKMNNNKIRQLIQISGKATQEFCWIQEHCYSKKDEKPHLRQVENSVLYVCEAYVSLKLVFQKLP